MLMTNVPTTRKPLTERQDGILQFLKRYMQQHGFPPTIQEICVEFNFSSTNAATQFLLALEKKGYIKRTVKGASRGLQILDEQGNRVITAAPANSHPSLSLHSAHSPARREAPVPEGIKNLVIIGEGTSANPLSVFMSPCGQVKADTKFFVPSASDAAQFFAAIVTDDGMNIEGLRQNDIVIVRQQFQAEDGNLVVLLAHDMVLVRRFVSVGTISELVASTPAFPRIPYRGNDASLAIIGVVVGMMRSFGT